MGHLDQHYAPLDPAQTAAELVGGLRGDWTYAECRKHLNDFLFRKNEEVNTPVARLSGGERARLSLALIAAQTPRLLLLDEVTNNLDLETREHVLEVLKGFPGAILVVSHDVDFLERLGVEETITIGKGQYSN
jgi:ATPase subunit of ABC transporter with duplicated ATPase domains